MKTNKVNRVEIIDHQSEKGRVFVKYDCEIVDIQLQDNNKTLKVFISKKKTNKG